MTIRHTARCLQTLVLALLSFAGVVGTAAAQAPIPPAPEAGASATSPELLTRARRCRPVKDGSQLTVGLAPKSMELREAAVRLTADRPSLYEFRETPFHDTSLAGWTPTCSYGEYLLLCHDPLYFEDTSLERYGEQDTVVLQPLGSAIKFFATVPCVPYKIALNHYAAKQGEFFACDHHGQLRPGAAEGAVLPFRLVPAAMTAALVTGLVIALP